MAALSLVIERWRRQFDNRSEPDALIIYQVARAIADRPIKLKQEAGSEDIGTWATLCVRAFRRRYLIDATCQSATPPRHHSDRVH